jgi:hypothetical protein
MEAVTICANCSRELNEWEAGDLAASRGRPALWGNA